MLAVTVVEKVCPLLLLAMNLLQFSSNCLICESSEHSYNYKLTETGSRRQLRPSDATYEYVNDGPRRSSENNQRVRSEEIAMRRPLAIGIAGPWSSTSIVLVAKFKSA